RCQRRSRSPAGTAGRGALSRLGARRQSGRRRPRPRSERLAGVARRSDSGIRRRHVPGGAGRPDDGGRVGGGATMSEESIARVEAFPLRYAEPNNNNKIRHVTLVRLESAGGGVGWGEAITGTDDASLARTVNVDRGFGP